MQYILFIHHNASNPASQEQWDCFFEKAKQSGVFFGGSEINKGKPIGTKPSILASETIAGYMLFETDDVSQIHDLLKYHPVVIQGGTIELCEAPKSS